MAITQPIGLYGLWNVTFKDRVTKLPQAFFKVIGEFTFPNEADMEDYYGGGDKFIRASEPKYFKSDGTFQFKQFNKESYTYLGGAANTPGTAEPLGAVTTLTNANGTSCQAATTGIASVALKSGGAADLKAGNYTVKVVSATTVDVYCDSDIDFGSIYTGGAVASYVDDTLKITASPLTITTGAALTEVVGFGIDLVGGSGTIAMTIGDTATFEVRPANVANEVITIGDRNTFLKSYSVSAYSVMKSITGEINYIYMPIVQVSGIGSLGLKEYSWVTSSAKVKILRSETDNYQAKIHRIQRLNA